MKANTLIADNMPKTLLKNKNKVPHCDNFLCNSTNINVHNDGKDCRNHEICVHKDAVNFQPYYTIFRDVGQADRTKRINTKLPFEALSFSSFFKYCAIFLLACDMFYLHINVMIVENTLESSALKIENLESQLKSSRSSYDTFKSDVNYLMHLNRMFSKDIDLKIELLIKLNKLFVDRADTSLNSIINILRNRKTNDNEILKIIKKRKSNALKQHLFPNRTVSLNQKFYPSDEQKVVAADNGLDIMLNEGNISSYSFDLEKSEFEPEILLKNTSISSSLFSQSDRHRSKRQTTNNSRSNNRGKHHNGKSKNRGQHRNINCNLFCCSAGPLLAHFRGAQPEALIQDGGVIAPWFGDVAASGDYIYRNIMLCEGKSKIEVTEKGLYLIYAQVYYLTSNQLNSFSINVKNEKAVMEKVVALCSTEAAVQGMSEVSCYTSVAHYLEPGDKIFLVQRERYRRVIFREGHTFLGVIALNNPPKC